VVLLIICIVAADMPVCRFRQQAEGACSVRTSGPGTDRPSVATAVVASGNVGSSDLATDASRSATAAESAESARGISPRAAHRSVRKPLDLYGSCHRTTAAAVR
jgi:hypothetical protein